MFSFFILAVRGGVDLGKLPPAIELHAILLAHGEVRVSEPDGSHTPRVSAQLVKDMRLHRPSNVVGGSLLHQSPSNLVRGPLLHQSPPDLVGARHSTGHHPTWLGAHRSTRTRRTRLGTRGSINQALWLGVRSLTN